MRVVLWLYAKMFSSEQLCATELAVYWYRDMDDCKHNR